MRSAKGARRAARARLRWAGALILAAGLQLALFALLDIRGRDRFLGRDATPAAVVTLAPPAVLHPAPPSSPPAHAPARSPASLPPAILANPAAPSPSTAPTPAPTISAPTSPGGGDLAAALRRSDVGCANEGADWMSDSEREHCRERLAANAAQVPRLEGMAPEKYAYYAAVAKAYDDWRTGRNPGRPIAIGCSLTGKPVKAPPHAIVIGPCAILPPRGSLDPDVDVAPPTAGPR